MKRADDSRDPDAPIVEHLNNVRPTPIPRFDVILGSSAGAALIIVGLMLVYWKRSFASAAQFQLGVVLLAAGTVALGVSFWSGLSLRLRRATQAAYLLAILASISLLVVVSNSARNPVPKPQDIPAAPAASKAVPAAGQVSAGGTVNPDAKVGPVPGTIVLTGCPAGTRVTVDGVGQEVPVSNPQLTVTVSSSKPVRVDLIRDHYYPVYFMASGATTWAPQNCQLYPNINGKWEYPVSGLTQGLMQSCRALNEQTNATLELSGVRAPDVPDGPYGPSVKLQPRSGGIGGYCIYDNEIEAYKSGDFKIKFRVLSQWSVSDEKPITVLTLHPNLDVTELTSKATNRDGVMSPTFTLKRLAPQ